MAGTRQLPRQLQHLHDASAAARDRAAAELGDLLEARQFEEAVAAIVNEQLLQGALAEKDAVAQESMFNALSSAAMVGTPVANPALIADHLDHLPLNCLEHALLILGFSGDPAFIPKIEPFLRHPDEDIRRDAAEALQELRHRNPKTRSNAV